MISRIHPLPPVARGKLSTGRLESSENSEMCGSVRRRCLGDEYDTTTVSAALLVGKDRRCACPRHLIPAGSKGISDSHGQKLRNRSVAFLTFTIVLLEGDDVIYAKIRDLCPLKFPFLREVLGT